MSVAEDNAAKLINMLLAASTAGVYDIETAEWTGIVVPESPTVVTPVVTTTPTTSAYGYTLAQAEAIITNLNDVTAALITAGLLAS
jgi:nucleoside-diphosphate-sugar epimerase